MKVSIQSLQHLAHDAPFIACGADHDADFRAYFVVTRRSSYDLDAGGCQTFAQAVRHRAQSSFVRSRRTFIAVGRHDEHADDTGNGPARI